MSRQIIPLKYDWKFTRTDNAESMAVAYDDSAWKSVRVPHDWAIAGPFDRENDIQRIERKQADVVEGVTEITGRTGGLPHVGVGWYRKGVSIPAEAAGKRVRLEIDGAMSRSQVYCNGSHLGEWPYGYSSFAFDLTDVIKAGEPNLIAVRLENKTDSSRWYPGAGLYRNVRLVIMDSVHVAHWGTTVTTPQVTRGSATVNLKTTIENHRGASDVSLRTEIRDATSNVVASDAATAHVEGSLVFGQSFSVRNPKLWMPGQPNLYAITTEVLVDGVVVDAYGTPLGFRTLAFDQDRGFFINGSSIKSNGVCMHHDLGPL